MKKRILAMVFAAFMAMSVTGCGGSGNASTTQEAQTAGSAVAAKNAEQEPEPEATNEGDLGDYHVKILDAETGLDDYEGNPVIGVTYEYTNNSDENVMFEIAVNPQAFQDGVQLDTAITDTLSDEAENALKEIKPGTTITCEMYYVMTSDSDVEVEVSDLFGLDDTVLTKTFSVE